jgi:hypothetical protein
MGILSPSPRYGAERLDAACERALLINAIAYSSVNAILKSGPDRARPNCPDISETTVRELAESGSSAYLVQGMMRWHIIARSRCSAAAFLKLFT